MIDENLRITDRPWNGRCATTGLTMDEFAHLLDGLEIPDWVARAAVSINRSYPTCLQQSTGSVLQAGWLAIMIDQARTGALTVEPDLMRKYETDEKLDSDPQYPGEEPWVREVAVAICEKYTIRGLCDTLYIANTIRGEEIDADDPGRRYRRSP